MADDNSASAEASVSMLEKQITAAAQRGDRFAFAAAAERLGSLAEAQALVRKRGIVRMVDRAVRAATPVLELLPKLEERAAEEQAAVGDPTMFGHFAVFDEWTEIDSWFEGNFLERIAPGAFKKTFREHRNEIKVLFQHGVDPVIGHKPLGAVDELHEDERGAYYEVPLLDATYVRSDVLPGLEAGLYGASFAFRTMRDEFVEEPDPSDQNPKGLPERTLKELRVFEFSPVTFPAYPSATAGVKQAEAERATPPAEDAATRTHPGQSTVGAGSSHLVLGRRGSQPIPLKFAKANRKEEPRWLL